MKPQINEIYSMPMNSALRDHLINDLGFSEIDQKILRSIMYKDGDSNFHYDNTRIARDKFERRLRNINSVVFAELIRLSNMQME